MVWGDGPVDTGLVLLGEAPGEEEDASGLPFVGKAGREVDNQYLLRFTRVLRHEWYVTNVVKCRPPGNRTPKADEIAMCSRHLQCELDTIRPRVIGALGKTASSYLLGSDVDMEMLHGIPQRGANDVIIVPMYHPAAGLHDPSKTIPIQRDFEMLGKVVRGEARPEMWRDEIEHPDYKGFLSEPKPFMDVLAIDTETYVNGELFSVQTCRRPGSATFRTKHQLPVIPEIDAALLVMHNALFDLPVLRDADCRISSKIMDTMVMAYVLQDEPQGLKTLAYRHCGMQMNTFAELVRPAQRDKAKAYLHRVIRASWPEPKQILVWNGDEPRLKKPWPLARKAASIVKAYVKDPGVDMYARWQQIPAEEGRQLAESRLGPMPRAGIEHVPLGEAIAYACRDADATYRIFPKLWSRVKEHGLEQAFWIDMGIVDMVIDMMAYGMPTQPHKFLALASEFALHADEVESEISKLVGHYVNPGSSQQVARLLFTTLGLKSKKKSKKTGDDSTDQKYLEQMRGQHEVVGRILDWRKTKKLQTTYAESLPRLVDSAGRIHPRIKTTRTSTGRLAMTPNLQNIPVRSEEGRMIRDCFVTSDDHTFLSMDYAGIELRVLAHLSEDARMLEVYRNNGDLHAETAKLIFGVDKKDQDPYKHRIPAKTTNFSIVYGVSALGLRDSIIKNGGREEDWPEEQCEHLIAEWFKAYPGVKQFMILQETRARRYGYVWDMFGRIRRIPGVFSSVPSVVAGALREAGNQPVQATAQEIMKIAMADLTPVYQQWVAEGWYAKPINQVHDDLMWELELGVAKEVYTVCKIIMENAVRLSVPVRADGKKGQSWGSMKEITEWN
jgi:uracil-DNA glycosylase family 4